MRRTVLFLGGNGHCAARLVPARAALAAAGAVVPFDLLEVPYPGFEDRPAAPDFESFLASLSASIATAAGPPGTTIVYGTGIGGLLALCWRARGGEPALPLLLQAPVLWGLERRLMPRILRLGLARMALGRLFTWRWFQRRFARRQFERPLTPAQRDAFFDGYAHCPAAADFFTWLTPRLLRQLEHQFAAKPEALRQVGFWWGGRDRVVHLQELAWTEQALGTRWPVRRFPHWGHYPMIDEPEEWVRALNDVLANPEAVPGPVGPQAG